MKYFDLCEARSSQAISVASYRDPIGVSEQKALLSCDSVADERNAGQ
jgi:hypothetical protein